MPAFADAVQEVASTSGTTDFTMPDSAVQGHQSFTDGYADAAQIPYMAETRNSSGTVLQREVGKGTWDETNKILSRDTIYFSTNSNSKVDFASAPNVHGVVTANDLDGFTNTPGGSSGELQYNNAGAFGGITGSSVSGADLTLGGDLGVGSGNLLTSGNDFWITATSTGSVRIVEPVTQYYLANFNPTSVHINPQGRSDVDFYVQTDNQSSAFFVDASADTAAFNVTVTFGGDILPSTDSTYDLGAATARWAEIHADSMVIRPEGELTTQNLILRLGHSSQSVPLLEFQNASGTSFGEISEDGAWRIYHSGSQKLFFTGNGSQDGQGQLTLLRNGSDQGYVFARNDDNGLNVESRGTRDLFLGSSDNPDQLVFQGDASGAAFSVPVSIANPTSFADGSAAAPSVTFSSDTDTGLYWIGANQLGFSTGGTERVRFDSDGVKVGSGLGTGTPLIRYGTGTAAAPVFAFNFDTDTGMYRSDANEISFTTGGTDAMTIDASQDVTIAGSLTTTAGTMVLNGPGGEGSLTWSDSSSHVTLQNHTSNTLRNSFLGLDVGANNWTLGTVLGGNSVHIAYGASRNTSFPGSKAFISCYGTTGTTTISSTYTFASSSGTDNPFSIEPTYNQTGTAGSTDLLINRTETALGTGSHYLIDAQVDDESIFSVAAQSRYHVSHAGQFFDLWDDSGSGQAIRFSKTSQGINGATFGMKEAGGNYDAFIGTKDRVEYFTVRVGGTDLGRVTFQGPAHFVDGSVSAPSLTFADDTDTGFYRISANTVGLALGGTKYIEANGGTGRLGFGTSPAMSYEVNIDGNLGFTTTGAIFNVDNLTTGTSGANNLVIDCGTVRVGGDVAAAKINIRPGNTTRVPLAMQQHTGGTEKMVIIKDSSGTETMGLTINGFTQGDASGVSRFSYEHVVTASGADGDGVGINLRVENISGSMTDVGYIDAVYDDISTHTSVMKLHVRTDVSTMTEVVTIDGADQSTTFGGDVQVDGTIRGGTSSELTISGGVVTATQLRHSVDSEADAASDDLDTINGGTDGDLLVLRAENSARTIVCKDGTGNLDLNGDFSLDNTSDRLLLEYDGTNWVELCRSDNGA